MHNRAFTLLELAVVTAIVGLLSLILVPSLVEQVESLRRSAEERNLAEIEDLITRSLRETQGDRNVSSFLGHLVDGHAELATIFDSGGGHATIVESGAWYTKLGRLQGLSPAPGDDFAPNRHPLLWDLAHNEVDQPRWLFVGPEEAGQQRYLLVSLLAPSTRGLVVPASDGTAAWFNAIWDHPWEGRGASLPTDWLSRLSAAEVQAWLAGRGETTNVSLLQVRRIVQPKHRVIINNSHPLYSAWLDVEGRSGVLTSAPASGVLTSDEILAGRQIVVRRGLADPGTEACRFYLHEPTSITVQP